MLWILALCAVGLLWALLRILGKRFDAELKGTLESIERHMGRAPDCRSMHRGSPEFNKIFAVYVPERKIYFGRRPGPFQEANFHDSDYIRSWEIVWDSGVYNNGRAYRCNYAFVMTVKDINQPLIKLPCGDDEKLAHQLSEAVAQMFEGQGPTPATKPEPASLHQPA
jgi:ketosteroid isomerase-like protein